jgi:dTDP-glucose pyrophosphorylase/CBS domain-containing protein
MISDVSKLCIAADSLIRQAATCIESNDAKIALVVDENLRLIDTITDGDVRRAMLSGLDLDSTVNVLRDRKADSPHKQPLTAPFNTDPVVLLRLMQESGLGQVPLLDEEQQVVGLVTLRDLLPHEVLPPQAVVMAGGYGTRLRPLTDERPKPMLPVGGRPLLELVIEQLRDAGIRQVNLTTHYKRELISEHFGDGQDFGVEIRYVEENQPLGTAGALSMLDQSDEPLLVINGDILTQVDFVAMLDFHREHHADMTVAVRQLEFRVPYGVVETVGAELSGITEKPVLKHFINAGIYLIDQKVRQYVPNSQACDMPDFINRLIAEKCRVVSFPIHEYWLDIGRIEDYKRALADFESRKR